MATLESEELESPKLLPTTGHAETSNRTKSDDSSTALRGGKRKTPDDDDDDNNDEDDCDDDNSESRQSNERFAVKRKRSDALIVVADEADEAEADADYDQNQSNDSGDEFCDDRSNQVNDGETMQENGKRTIDSAEAFKQGYVVVIPSKQKSFSFKRKNLSFAICLTFLIQI